MARKNKFPGVYARFNTLWIRYNDASGKQARESTGLPVGQERQAFTMLRQLKARSAYSKVWASRPSSSPATQP